MIIRSFKMLLKCISCKSMSKFKTIKKSSVPSMYFTLKHPVVYFLVEFSSLKQEETNFVFFFNFYSKQLKCFILFTFFLLFLSKTSRKTYSRTLVNYFLFELDNSTTITSATIAAETLHHLEDII